MKTILCIIATITLLTGCALTPPINKQTPSDVAARTTIIPDNFRKVISVKGEPLQKPTSVFAANGLNDYTFWMSAMKSQTHTNYSIVFSTVRGYDYGWAFWEQAFDSDGNQLPVIKLNSDVADGGIIYESVAVDLTRDYINKHKSGITIRIDGQRAQQIISIPQNYIEGFIDKISSIGL